MLRRLLNDALKQLIPIAEEVGVDLALEPMHPGCATEWTFLTSFDDVLAVIQSFDSTRLKLVFDTYHLGFDSKAIEQVAGCIDRVALVQLGDGKAPPEGDQNRCLLGEGIVPWRKWSPRWPRPDTTATTTSS